MNTYRLIRYLSVFLFAAVLLAGGQPAMAFSADNQCSTAITVPTVVTPTAFTDSGDTTGYASTGDAVISTCDVDPDSSNNHSVWWTWTSPASPGPVEVSTFGSDYDTIVNIYSTATDCSALVAVTCNDDAGASFQSKAVFTPAASTVYYFQVIGYDSLEEGNLSLYVGDPQCTTAEDTPYAASTNDQWQSSINETAEVVYAEYNPATLYDQIMKDGAALTPAVDSAVSHVGPANNNLGEIVWSEDVGGYEQVMKRDAAGTVTQVTAGNVNHSDPDINDSGEIVWSEDVGIYFHIVSSTRGQLTTVEPAWYYSPAINNGGEVCWSQYDAVNGQQVACLGGYTTTGLNPKYNPSVNNLGDLVWEEENSVTGDVLINSTGAFADTGCPAGGHYEPSINACGDVVFTNFDGSTEQIYLTGTGTSCVPTISGVTPDPVDPRGSAFTITGTSFQIPADATSIDICADGSCSTVAASLAPTTDFTVDSDTQITATDPGSGVFADGNYYIRVNTPAGGSNIYGGVLFGNCDPATDPVTGVTLTFNPPGPDYNIGDVINLSALVTGGCGYKNLFQVKDVANNKWSPVCSADFPGDLQSDCLWDTTGFPAGAYWIRVVSQNETGDTSFALDYNGTNVSPITLGGTPPCDPTGLTPTLPPAPISTPPGSSDKLNPTQVPQGTTITFDMSGSTGLCGAMYRCQYDKPIDALLWGLNMGYYSPEFVRDLPVTADNGFNVGDTFTVRCFVYNNYQSPPVYDFDYTYWQVAAGGAMVSLSATPSGNQTVEHDQAFQTIDLTATPSNFTPTSYTFEVNKDGGGWGPIAACPAGPSAVCSWDAEANGEGSYQFRVTATDGVDSPTDQLAACSLVKNPPVVTLSTDLPPPQEVGAVVQLTATPLHFLNTNTAEYHFMYRAVGAPSFTDLCGTASLYTAGTTCNWDTAALSAGDYDLKVDAGDVGTNTQMATDSLVFPLTPAPTLADVTAITPSSIVDTALPQAGVVFDGVRFTGITGAALDDGINNYALVSVSFVSDTQFTADVPAGVLPGTYNVQVTTGAGTNLTSSAMLTISTSCDPALDPVTGVALTIGTPGGTTLGSLVNLSANVTGGCGWTALYQVKEVATNKWTPICSADYPADQQSSCQWDTSGFPTGEYWVRVVANNVTGDTAFALDYDGTNVAPFYVLTGAPTCDPTGLVPVIDNQISIASSAVKASPAPVSQGTTITFDMSGSTGLCGAMYRCQYDKPIDSLTWGLNMGYYSPESVRNLPVTAANGFNVGDTFTVRCFVYSNYQSPVQYSFDYTYWEVVP